MIGRPGARCGGRDIARRGQKSRVELSTNSSSILWADQWGSGSRTGAETREKLNDAEKYAE